MTDLAIDLALTVSQVSIVGVSKHITVVAHPCSLVSTEPFFNQTWRASDIEKMK